MDRQSGCSGMNMGYCNSAGQLNFVELNWLSDIGIRSMNNSRCIVCFLPVGLRAKHRVAQIMESFGGKSPAGEKVGANHHRSEGEVWGCRPSGMKRY